MADRIEPLKLFETSQRPEKTGVAILYQEAAGGPRVAATAMSELERWQGLDPAFIHFRDTLVIIRSRDGSKTRAATIIAYHVGHIVRFPGSAAEHSPRRPEGPGALARPTELSLYKLLVFQLQNTATF